MADNVAALVYSTHFIEPVLHDPAEFAKPFVRPALAIAADARRFLHTLAHQALAQTLPDFSDWARWCRALPSRYPVLQSHHTLTPR